MNSLLLLAWLNPAAVVERLGWVLLHSLWQFAIVGFLAGITVSALRRSSAAIRYVALVTRDGYIGRRSAGDVAVSARRCA